MSNTERRQYPRVPTAKGCKIYHPASLRYWPGATRNLSRGGALLTLETTRAVSAGEQLDLVINWSNRPVLAAESMIRASVVRADPPDGVLQTVAVRFDRPRPLAVAA